VPQCLLRPLSSCKCSSRTPVSLLPYSTLDAPRSSWYLSLPLSLRMSASAHGRWCTVVTAHSCFALAPCSPCAPCSPPCSLHLLLPRVLKDLLPNLRGGAPPLVCLVCLVCRVCQLCPVCLACRVCRVCLVCHRFQGRHHPQEQRGTLSGCTAARTPTPAPRQ